MHIPSQELRNIETWEQLSLTLEKNQHLHNEERIVFFEALLQTLWKLYQSGGSDAAFQGLNIWMKEIQNFSRYVQEIHLRKRMLTILCMSYLLQGSIAVDKMEYDQAHTAYQQAFCVAYELDDPELIASAFTRTGGTFILQDEPMEAIPYLQGAIAITEKLKLPTLKGTALEIIAEAHAKTGEFQKSMQTIELVEDILSKQEHVEERGQFYFGIASLIARKGTIALLQGDYQYAIDLIDKSLINHEPTSIRGKAQLLTKKAEAYYGMGEIDACVIVAEKALSLARAVGSNKNIARIHKLQTELMQSQWAKEPVVAHLGTLLSKN